MLYAKKDRGFLYTTFLLMVFFVDFNILCASEIYPQSYVMTDFSIEDGLSGESITALYQDSKGFIWIGTCDGLNCYDGYTFTVYRHNMGDKSSISGNYIKSIAEDSEGNLWIGTFGNGLNKWDRKKNTFNTIQSLFIPEKNICGLKFDTDSILWIKTDNYLVGYNYYTHQNKVHDLISNVFNCEEAYKTPLCFRSSELLWIGTNEGMRQFNKKNQLYEGIQFTSSSSTNTDFGSVSGIIPLEGSKFLVSGNKGVFELLDSNNKGEVESKKVKMSSGISSINAILNYSQGGIWVGTKEGLRILDYDRTTKQIVYNPQNYFNKSLNLITREEVSCLLEDNSGLLWVGTKYKGLIKLDFKPKRFRKLECKEDDGLEKCDVRCIHVDDADRLWLGTADKGIKIVDLKQNYIYNYPVNLSAYRVGEDKILSMCKDSKGRLWLGTAKGIYIYYESMGEIREFSYVESSKMKNLLRQNQINAIEEDMQGNIWFGTKFGLYKYDGKSIDPFFADDKNSLHICNDVVNTLFRDSEGILWIGTNSGVNFIDTTKPGLVKFEVFDNSNDSVFVLSDNWILTITEDYNNRIWFGTRSGITYYNKISKQSGFYTQDDGLNNDLIKGVVCDQNGYVWLSTNKGISLINRSNNVFNFDLTDGLPGYVYNNGAVAVSKSNKIYFGGIEGIAYLNPDSLLFNYTKPNVVFTGIELYHKGKKVQKYDNFSEAVSFKYKKSSLLKVKFAALEFTEPHKNQFQTYLEGFDDDWRPVTFDNELDFSDLPAGEYKLYVRGSNSDYIWSNEPAKLDITVIPPIWMTNYAYAFYLIALVFLVQVIINYRIRHYKVAYKSLEEKAVDKEMIEAQRELLSRINLSLTDSIYYAKRIQESILPSESLIKNALSDSFVYYRPKDVVSGDFYWMYETEGKIYVAAVDCTGHGVPGAFMSIIAYDLLKSIVSSGIDLCPANILNSLSKEVIKTFKKDEAVANNTVAVNDSMDIALCVIDMENRKMSFAGAYNPLYLVRNNEVLVYKGDRFPIGHQSEKELNFTKHDIAIEPNDTFYIFSDGFVDQFGGSEGKKFKYRRFRHLLLNIHKLPADDQKSILHQKLEEWMGDYEQVDDIIIIGMRPIVELV